MKLKGHKIKYFSHYKKHYWLRYLPPGNMHILTLTIPIKKHGMFQFRTTANYKYFMSRTPHYCSEYKDFSGTAHVIPDDANDTIPPSPKPPSVSSHKSTGQTREPSAPQIMTPINGVDRGGFCSHERPPPHDQSIPPQTREPLVQTREAPLHSVAEPPHKRQKSIPSKTREHVCHAKPNVCHTIPHKDSDFPSIKCTYLLHL